jgi:hypothetical protein
LSQRLRCRARDRIASLLAAYDAQLRTDTETPSALSVTHLGPLCLVTFAGGRGFVTYKDLGGADTQAIQSLVTQAVAHYRGTRKSIGSSGKPAGMTMRADWMML